MTKRIFISYRRDDSAGHAGRVFDRLRTDFGQDVLFMDVDAIPLGVNFVRVLREEVTMCDVLLAIIGPGWLGAKDDAGVRRLENPNDFVRIEIAAALQRDIPMIPILLEGTKMPNAAALPADLAELPQRNALDVRHASFHADMDKLVRGLKTGKGTVGNTSQPSPTLQIVTAPPPDSSWIKAASDAAFAASQAAYNLHQANPGLLSSFLVSKPATAIPTAEEVIADEGNWVQFFEIDFASSERPSMFDHFFIIIRGDKLIAEGAIVQGHLWRGGASPTWATVYGYRRMDRSNWQASPHALTYLGPTWRPEYAALSDAVFKKLGGKPLERFVTHR